MSDKQKSEVEERYEEAALSFLMEKYAEEDGARILQEFEDASKNGDVPEVPAELDAKCRQIIQSSFAKQDIKYHLRQITKGLAKVAVFVFVFLGIATTVVLSVDALRIPVLNFLLEKHDRYSSISFSAEETTPFSDDLMGRIYDAPIPEGYELVIQNIESDNSVTLCYENEASHAITIIVLPMDVTSCVDTEDADQVEIDVNGHQAFFVEKEGFHIVWADKEKNLLYNVFASGLDTDSFWTLVFFLAE